MRYALIPFGFIFYVWFLATFIPLTVIIATIVILIAPVWPKAHSRKLRYFAPR